MKHFKIIIIFCFWIILIIPTLLMNTKNEQISLIDNSKLPEFNSVYDISSFENYLSKRVGFRTFIIKAYTTANDKLFNKMIHPSYTYGTNDYVFFKISGPELHDDSYLDSFAELIKKIQTYINDRGSYFLFFINPDKLSVYEQYLPKGYNYTNYRINYLKKKFDELNINYIDNLDCLKSISKKEQIFNKQYDAGHWNDIGGFYALNNVYDKLISDGFNIEKLSKSDYILNYETVNSLPVSEFKINEQIPVFEEKSINYYYTNNYSNIIKLNSRATYYLESTSKNVKNDYTLLFFRDSYINRKEKFISNTFHKTYYVHSYHNAINADYYYNIIQPDIVLMDAVEYGIWESFYPISSIETKNFNNLYSNYKDLPKNEFIDLNIDEIKNTIQENIQNNSILITLDINKHNFKYAYLRINKSKAYDFIYENDIASISINTDLLKEANSIDLIFINNKETKKQIINIK